MSDGWTLHTNKTNGLPNLRVCVERGVQSVGTAVNFVEQDNKEDGVGQSMFDSPLFLSNRTAEELLWAVANKTEPTPLESALADKLEELLLEVGWDCEDGVSHETEHHEGGQPIWFAETTFIPEHHRRADDGHDT